MLHAARSSDAPPILEPLAPIASCGFQFQAMSSVCEIRLDAAPGQCEPALAAAAREAIDEVRRIELKYSRYRDDSIVSRINAAAGHDASIEVDAETAALLDFAGVLHAWSDGLFDITSGVLRQAWNFHAARVPEAAALEALLPLIGWQQVEWSPTGAPARRIRLPRAGMELDFGGFGKE
ncbi:MAG: FAD:protein FMN transferase, partial [Burkholderiales bacterium]|nr:FAD:protein FMN transferase [Burkholderiales bacterium]